MIRERRDRPSTDTASAKTNGHAARDELEQTVPAVLAPNRPAAGWQRWRGLVLYAVIWLAFITLRTYGGRTPIAHALSSADASLEQRLFGGELPTIRLQRQLTTPSQLHWYDFVATSFEWSFFVVPHILAIFLWRRHPVRFRRFLRATALLLGTGLLIYYLIPSDPPWYLADRPITRIMISVGRDVFDGFYTGIDRSIGEGNPIAAMPSIHFAIIVLLAATLWSLNGTVRWLTVCYAGLMGISLVYLGEHYIIDLIIGGIIALYSWWLSSQWGTSHPETPSCEDVSFRAAAGVPLGHLSFPSAANERGSSPRSE